MQKDIYDTADVIKQDTLWSARLRNLANGLDDKELCQIADRLKALLQQHIIGNTGQDTNNGFICLGYLRYHCN